MLAQIINQVRASDMELEKKARVLAYLGSTMLTSMRDGDLEEQIAEIKEQIKRIKEGRS